MLGFDYVLQPRGHSGMNLMLAHKFSGPLLVEPHRVFFKFCLTHYRIFNESKQSLFHNF
jgi:hypothetical protein